MRQPAHAPGLVDRRGRPDAVADAAHHHLGEVAEPARDVAVAPAAQIGERRGQFPVVERGGGLEPAREHPVHEPVVEVEPLRIGGAAPLGQDPRPGGGEAVDIEVRARQQVEIGLPAVVMVAGARAVLGPHDVAGRGREAVPVGRARAAEGVPLDLVARSRGPEEETFGEVAAREIHLYPFSRARPSTGAGVPVRSTARPPDPPRSAPAGPGSSGRRSGRAPSARPRGPCRGPRRAAR
jgi:hypothetical protein